MPKIELVFDERFDHVRCTAVQCTDPPNIMRLMYFEWTCVTFVGGMDSNATDNRSSFVRTFLPLGSAPLLRSCQMIIIIIVIPSSRIDTCGDDDHHHSDHPPIVNPGKVKSCQNHPAMVTNRGISINTQISWHSKTHLMIVFYENSCFESQKSVKKNDKIELSSHRRNILAFMRPWFARKGRWRKQNVAKSRQKGWFWAQSLTSQRTLCCVRWDNSAWIHPQSISTRLRRSLGGATFCNGGLDT